MPLVKLGYLLIRTVAKPIANGIKRQARDHPAFRRACIAVAQSYHRWEVKLKRGLDVNKKRIPIAVLNRHSGYHSHHQNLDDNRDGLSNEAAIRPLDEAKAVEVGSEFIGEALVFIVAGTLLVLDQLSSRKRDNERNQEIERRIKELYSQVESLKQSQKV